MMDAVGVFEDHSDNGGDDHSPPTAPTVLVSTWIHTYFFFQIFLIFFTLKLASSEQTTSENKSLGKERWVVCVCMF